MTTLEDAPPTANAAPGPITHLVSGILDDAKSLAQQQLAMFKSELREDFHTSIRASQLGGASIVFTTTGVLALVTAIVYLLHEQLHLSLWASWGIIGSVFTALGIGLALACNSVIRSFSVVPDKTLAAIKDNLTWTHKK